MIIAPSVLSLSYDKFDEQLKELTHKHRSSNKVFDKLFGYFFDN